MLLKICKMKWPLEFLLKMDSNSFTLFFLCLDHESKDVYTWACNRDGKSFHCSLSDSSSFPLVGHTLQLPMMKFFFFKLFLREVKMNKNEVIGLFCWHNCIIRILFDIYWISFRFQYCARCCKCVSLFNSSNKLMYYLSFVCEASEFWKC